MTPRCHQSAFDSGMLVSLSSQMPVEIHALMEDTNHVYLFIGLSKEDDVGAYVVSKVAGPNVGAGPPGNPVVAQAFDRASNEPEVDRCLVVSPLANGVGSDLFNVALRARPKTRALHEMWRGASFRSARSASKSNGVASPLSSPFTKASRSAFIRVSRSSSRRRPARKTSSASWYRPDATCSVTKEERWSPKSRKRVSFCFTADPREGHRMLHKAGVLRERRYPRLTPVIRRAPNPRLDGSIVSEGCPQNTPASDLIDARIAARGDWRARRSHVSAPLIHEAVPDVVETVKWRGVPVWEHDGILCTGETYKATVKLTFAKARRSPIQQSSSTRASKAGRDAPSTSVRARQSMPRRSERSSVRRCGECGERKAVETPRHCE